MEKQTLDLTDIAHGGSAIGRASRGRTVFVPFAIPGEKVRVEITSEKKGYAHANLLQVLRPSPDRIEPRCRHFGVCGGCHFQHMTYEAQLKAKQAVVSDQLARIGGLRHVDVQPVLPHPNPWEYRTEITLNPTEEGGLGYWSPVERRIFPIEECPISRPELIQLLHDVELDLPGLRKLTLRLGDDEALLAAMEVEGVEPPELAADFPVSVAIVLPDNTAASLVGDNYSVQAVKGRDFRVSPGCDFPYSPEASERVVDVVRYYVAETGDERVVEGYGGVGVLTAFLAEETAGVIAIEQNPDAVADAAVNLADLDNVYLYEGRVEEVLPALDVVFDVLVVNPPDNGLSKQMIEQIQAIRPFRIIYVSSEVATLARDGKQLSRAGYELVQVQPVDVRPQTFHVDTVSFWEIGE